MSSLQKRIARAHLTQVTLGTIAAHYLRLVWKTSRFELEPADIYEAVEPDLPAILAMWHGQHFMAPFIKRERDRAKVLISLHRDGEINAVAAERLGIEAIRGSGGRYDRKGGVGAFREMLDALAQGYNVALTADVPKIARVVGRGIVMLARESQRPIFPIAVATSRRIELDNWDRSTINLPFSRGAMVGGKAIRIPPDADETTLENRRRAVEAELNLVTERAYALADRSGNDRGNA
jgi:lysophospholipid acyltransferase (LPLAT)-like uncharacterized protein